MFEINQHRNLTAAVVAHFKPKVKPKTELISDHTFNIVFQCGSFLSCRAVDPIYDERSMLPAEKIKPVQVNVDRISLEGRYLIITLSYNTNVVTFVCSHFNYSLA